LGVELLDDGILGLPTKFSSFRNGQSAVVSHVYKAYEDGKRFEIAEMPTGTGKTFIAMAVKQLLDVPTIYVCTTKSLQDQFLGDFPSAKLIKGRNNYACGRVPQKFPDVTAEDCLGEQCVSACAYARAKDEARKAPLVVTNMSYFLTEIQHGKQFAGRGFVVVDEADTLEDALLDQVSVQITQFDVEKMKLGAPALKTKFEEWHKWAVEALKTVRLSEQAASMELQQYNSEEAWHTAPITLIREARNLGRLAGKMAFFLKYVDQYWVWETSDSYTRTGGKYWKWIFKPVRVDQFGDMVFNAGGKFLLMSATILDAFQYERNVGLAKYREEALVDYIEVDSSFDKTRRPVIVRKGVDLTYKVIDKNLPELRHTLGDILRQHPNEKGLIHAVTYRISKEIEKAFPGRVLVHTSQTRAAVIKRFKESKEPLVLVSPSAERGEDFPDDICRFIVIVKLPFPYLGDPRVERRLYSMKDGQKWYALRTISKLIQMTGRGMRHELDTCTSYILDPGFRRVFMENRSMFPKWWKEALIWEEGGSIAKRTVQPQVREDPPSGSGEGIKEQEEDRAPGAAPATS
jgi:ATP-dependent DNA helicase DinG